MNLFYYLVYLFTYLFFKVFIWLFDDIVNGLVNSPWYTTSNSNPFASWLDIVQILNLFSVKSSFKPIFGITNPFFANSLLIKFDNKSVLLIIAIVL